ncbi:MAG: lysophospholipid acyltransferase family protein [Bacillota bacterium]
MLYRIVRAILRPIWFLLFRLHVAGLENIPQAGPVILCCNHFLWADPITMAVAVPRSVHFMAKEELFRAPVLGPLLPLVGAFPVRRGTADRASLKQALAVLSKGEVFGIFPEGTRSRTRQLLRPEPGVVWIAAHARAPVVPMAISGDYRFFRRLSVRVGRPVDLGDLLEQKLRGEVLETGANRVSEAIASLLAEPA